MNKRKSKKYKINRHQIIGLIVLIAIGVIIGQYCLNYYKGNSHRLQVYRSPPIAPVDESNTSESNAPKIQTVETLVKEHFNTTSEDVPAVPAWIVQVATFTEDSDAQSLKEQLQALGFDAFISSVSRENESVYRVAAGPFTEQLSAVYALTTIQEKLKVTGVLKQYTIMDGEKEIDP